MLKKKKAHSIEINLYQPNAPSCKIFCSYLYLKLYSSFFKDSSELDYWVNGCKLIASYWNRKREAQRVKMQHYVSKKMQVSLINLLTHFTYIFNFKRHLKKCVKNI